MFINGYIINNITRYMRGSKSCNVFIILVFQDILEFWHENFVFPDKFHNQHILTCILCAFITFIWYNFKNLSLPTSRSNKIYFVSSILCNYTKKIHKTAINLSDLFHVPLTLCSLLIHLHWNTQEQFPQFSLCYTRIVLYFFKHILFFSTI